MRPLTIAAAVLLLAGCAAAPTPTPAPTPTTAPAPPVPGPIEIATGLAAPWSVVRLESGSALISERDTAIVKELTADGAVREVATIEGVAPGGEGGLLGLESDGETLFVYYTAADDNRIERFDLLGDPGSYRLSGGTVILDGLAKAGNHNGGRIKLGPDGMLYATVGDAGDPGRAQDGDSLNGKILRMEVDGGVPADNPFDGSLVYSLGHRNPQGIAWDDQGQLWAAEFGQNTWDEFNRIKAGGNYGWPEVEGTGGEPDYIDPVLQWATDDASPSGLAYVDGSFYLASLKGQRVWVITDGAAVPALVGQYGRLRDVVAGPEGTVWILTNNTDGRGTPHQGDDRIVQWAPGDLVGG